MKIWEACERAVTVVIAFSAVILAATHLRATLQTGRGGADTSPPTFVSSWQDALAIGTSISGSEAAPVKIVALVDYECPACARLHRSLDQLILERGGEVQVVYVDYPLSIHRFAGPAARAAQCARSEGKFAELVDQFYTKQDSIGLKSWTSFASDVGIVDTARIQMCALTQQDADANIVAGRAFGDEIGIVGTPTVLVNGWRFHRTPSKRDLVDAIANILSGDAPT